MSSQDDVNIYHCICTTLILTTVYDLSKLPCRKETEDAALILHLDLPNTSSIAAQPSILHSAIAERKPILIKRDDGFEKRLAFRCKRCDVVVGYKLDEAHFSKSVNKADEVFYILPGSLVNTQDMKTGRAPDVPGWAQNV